MTSDAFRGKSFNSANHMATAQRLGRRRKLMGGVLLLGVLIVAIPIGSGIRIALIAVRLFSLNERNAASVPFAMDSLQSNNSLIRRAAARGLGQIGPDAKEAIPELLAALENDCWEVASEAAWSLGRVDSAEPRVIDGLISALGHEHGEVRRYAAYSLSFFGVRARSAVPELTKRLGDEHMGYMAARALGEIGPDARVAIGELTELLTSSSWAVRAEAASAFANLTPLPSETVGALQKLANDEEPIVRDAARKTLQHGDQ